ncbi:MAG TPA: hypothetical protein VGY66_03300 [Gemmataceae bacterium]|jgi:hypothetical protein|nr:hypothetical protein [Gemmataceae bacterium]
MLTFGSIFSDFKLPTAATWFYFSMLLALALFFKFSRLLSMRNWDVVTIFLLVPGLLLLQESRIQLASQVAGHLGWSSQAIMASGLGSAVIGSPALAADPGLLWPSRLAWYGYLWLICGSAYFLIRCLIDLALVRRPALSPNLNLGGMAWLGTAFFGCLVSVAARQYETPPPPVGKTSPPLKEAERGLTDLVNQQNPTAEGEGVNTRFIVACTLAMLGHLAVVVGLVVIGYRVFQDPAAGMAAATFYLLLPYTAMHVGQAHHVWPSALLVWAVVFYRRPIIAGLLLGLAAGSVYFPALLFPIWFSFYWGRGAWRFASAFAISAFIIFVITGLTLDLAEWQAWKAPTGESIWRGVHWAYRIPVFIAFLAFVIATFFWPAPKNLAHLLALSAAVLIGIQFWYAEQGGVYVLWYLPLMLLLVFRPNLSDRQPPLIPMETDWLLRLGRKLRTWTSRLLNLPQPTARVH